MSAAYLTNGDGPSEILSFEEVNRFKACEAVVEKGLQTFVEVGASLLEIRDNRYYRQEFDTFEAYCRQRWQMGASRARQLIGAAEVVKNLNTEGESVTIVTPTHESQVRPLTKLDPEQQREVWQSATRLSPKPTAELVAKIAE
jgi:hypothetical protein